MLRQAADWACSHAERVFHRLLQGARIGDWVANHLVVLSGIDYWIDVAFEECRLAIEVDGWAWHSDVDRFVHDWCRQNALVLAGWTVLRFTGHELSSSGVPTRHGLRRLQPRPAHHRLSRE